MSEAKEWIIPKGRFFETDTGRNLAEFYRERIIGPYSDDPNAEYQAWLESFDFVRVRVYPEEGRVCFALLTEYGRLQDEHCEDLYTPEEIVADMREAERHERRGGRFRGFVGGDG